MERGASGELSHQEVWELIPWHVNGTLEGDEARGVDAHLSVCPICREEVRSSRRLAAAVGSVAVDVPPAERGLAALWARVDAGSEDRAAAVGLLAGNGAGSGEEATVAAGRPGRLTRLAAALGASPPALRWVVAAQLAVILLLTGVLLGRRTPASEPLFHTLSDPGVESAAAPARLRLRVVFDEGANLGELRELLLGLGAEIVGGPSPTGVYTIEVGARESIERSVVESLRGHPEVVFAEPVTYFAPPGRVE